MLRSVQFMPAAFAVAAFALLPRVSDAATAVPNASTTVVDLTPFTHIGYIPANADISSIKLQGIKTVKVATKQRSVTDFHYCEERVVTEPGGSMYCPLTTDENSVSAYKVTYMFTAPPMVSDEYGGRSFTFSVYFRPDELSPSLRDALTSNKLSRQDLSEYFHVATSTESVQNIVIDEGSSEFCNGDYVDGNWTHTNPGCQDRIVFKNVATASPYIKVRVDPASTRLEAYMATTGLSSK